MVTASVDDEHLVGEGVAHDEGRVSHGTPQVDQPAFGQDDDVVAVFQQEAVDLRQRRRHIRVAEAKERNESGRKKKIPPEA